MTRIEPTQDLASDIIHRTREADRHGNTSTWPELPVLGAQALIERVGLERLIPLLRVRLGFPREVFALAAWPLIAGYAEFVQLLPVAGSKWYGSLGGQLYRGLATGLRALEFRRGQILPRGAAPEIIGEHTHRWTYAVFAAALLRDAPKVCAGWGVWLNRSDGSLAPWDPTAGSMSARRGSRYRIETLPSLEQPCAFDSALAATLFERCVPDAIRAWLSEDAGLMPELLTALSGRCDPANAIGQLVERATVGSSPPAKLQSPAQMKPAPNSAVAVPKEDLKPSVPSTMEPEYLDAVREEGSEFAHRFMDWLREGIVGGTLSVNIPDALVHRVAEGLLLASPRIFRVFAKEAGHIGGLMGPNADRDGGSAKRLQRELLRAGWHLQAERGVNFLSYQWKGDKRTTSRINGLVVVEPGRFVDPLPPVNPELVRAVDSTGHLD